MEETGIRFGKLREPAVDSASTVADSRRLFVYDKKSKTRFLIDTGAEVSVIPPKQSDRKNKSPLTLTAANKSVIQTFGNTILELDLGLRRTFSHLFIIADVGYPIIGADFLSHFSLLPDLRNRKLIDGNTEMSVRTSIFGIQKSNSHLSDNRIPTNLQVSLDGIPPQVTELIKRYPELLIPNYNIKDVKHSVQHYIRTIGSPVSSRFRRLPPEKYKPVKSDFEKMCEQGICKRTDSPWSSPIHVVPKKNSTEWRACGDYRRLNAITEPDKYPVPHLQDFNQRIGSSKVFSTIDLVRAYNQIPVFKDDIPKTAVTTPFGNFVFLRMPFGLRNAAQTFQRFMDEICKGLDFVFVYIDDIMIFSRDEAEHMQHLEILFRRLHENGIVINASKSNFLKSEVDFLGFHVSPQGIRPLPEKVKAITDFPKPNDAKQLLRFLGCVNFYRLLIPHAAAIQKPLYEMIEGQRTKSGKFRNTILNWNTISESAFEKTKASLANAVCIANRIPGAPLALFSDASDIAMGAHLDQYVNKQWEPLGFFSRKYTPAQLNSKYSAYSRELMGIKEGIRFFKDQLEGRDFVIFTDQKPLTYAFTKNHSDELPKTRRDLDYIAQFTTNIQHISGKDNVVADALSRIEGIQLLDYTELADAQKSDS